MAIPLMLAPAILPLVLAGCSSSEAGMGDSPYRLRMIKGVDWIDGREGFRPELPGFVLDADIGTIALKSNRADAPDRLVLLIRTSPAQRPNLEGFTFSTPGRIFETSPFARSAVVSVREPGHTGASGRVPLNAYFDFQIEDGFVRVTFLPSATELMQEECQVSWVDWYRR